MSTAIAAIAAATLVIGVVVFVAWPFVSPDPPPPEAAMSEVDRRRLAAAERRDEAYLALRDLEFDLRTGKVTRRGLPAGASAPALRCGGRVARAR